MTVSCPGSKEPYGGGFLTDPPPGQDGQGVYPNSYERLGAQGGYHITAALINPTKTRVMPRNLTLQVVCGKKIGPISDPHTVGSLDAGSGPKTLVAKCPKKQSLIGGGYQRSNGVTDAGVMTTESRRTSARTWQVMANDPGGFPGEAVAIGYCVHSKKPVVTEVAGSVTVPSRTSRNSHHRAVPRRAATGLLGLQRAPIGRDPVPRRGLQPERQHLGDRLQHRRAGDAHRLQLLPPGLDISHPDLTGTIGLPMG